MPQGNLHNLCKFYANMIFFMYVVIVAIIGATFIVTLLVAIKRIKKLISSLYWLNNLNKFE